MLYLAGMMLIGLVAVNADVNLLMVILGLGFGALVVSAFFNWIALRKIGVSRFVPDVVVAGRPFNVRFSITNRKRWVCSRGLHVVGAVLRGQSMAPPETFVSILDARETLTVDVAALCPDRGRVLFERIAVGTRFPFGLFTKYLLFDSRQEVVVFPRLGRLLTEPYSTARTRDQVGGDGPASLLTGDEEFYGVREYRLGDNPRRIHWRRSARTGQLMVREMSRSRAMQVWCVVNTRVDEGDAAAAARLEEAISCAATVVCDGLERGGRIGLVCNGEPLLVMPPGGGRGHRPRLLRELALRGRNHTDRLAPHVERMSWPARWRGPCLLFGANEDDDLAEAARALSRRLGPVSIYVPGTAAFGGLFTTIVAESPPRVGVGVGNRERMPGMVGAA